MRDGVVAQDLATAVLAGIIQRRPIIVSAALVHISSVQVQLESLLWRYAGITPQIVHSQRLSVSLGTTLSQTTSGPDNVRGVIYSRVDRLTPFEQAQLTEFLQSSVPPSRIVVLTRHRNSPNLIQPLCQYVFFDQFVDVGDPDLPLVSLPPASLDLNLHIEQIVSRIERVIMVPEIVRYIEDIVLFTRTHRLVRRGITPRSVRDLTTLIRILSIFSGLEYVTPRIIKAAARLLLPLRIEMCEASDEPSLEYGGEVEVVKLWMANWNAGIIVDSVLEKVPVPF